MKIKSHNNSTTVLTLNTIVIHSSLSPPPPLTQGIKTVSNFTRNILQSSHFIFLAPDGPPLNVKVTAESSSSLSVTWEPPAKDKRNGEIVNYSVCVSLEENKSCIIKNTTDEKTLTINKLNVSTKYYVRVLASTKVGPGQYSEYECKFTNGGKTSLKIVVFKAD